MIAKNIIFLGKITASDYEMRDKLNLNQIDISQLDF